MYKVLLVDDEYMVTEGLKRLIPFEKWDMKVVATANHADDALDYVKENPVDVVISDVNMPDKTGLEMIREMKELLPDTYYILLSGYQEFDYVKKSHEPQCRGLSGQASRQGRVGQFIRKNCATASGKGGAKSDS